MFRTSPRMRTVKGLQVNSFNNLVISRFFNLDNDVRNIKIKHPIAFLSLILLVKKERTNKSLQLLTFVQSYTGDD